jgi:hypothetical protein
MFGYAVPQYNHYKLLFEEKSLFRTARFRNCELCGLYAYLEEGCKYLNQRLALSR